MPRRSGTAQQRVIWRSGNTVGMLLRWFRIGAITGAIAGGFFGLAVVSFADCEGPDCTRERIVGVLAHVGGGALALGLVGLAAAGMWRILRRAIQRVP